METKCTRCGTIFLKTVKKSRFDKQAVYKTCETCRNKAKIAYYRKIKSLRTKPRQFGACFKCGEKLSYRDFELGSCYCSECSKVREQKLEHRRQKQKEYRQKLKSMNICFECGFKSLKGHVYCQNCLDKRKKYNQMFFHSTIVRTKLTSLKPGDLILTKRQLEPIKASLLGNRWKRFLRKPLIVLSVSNQSVNYAEVIHVNCVGGLRLIYRIPGYIKDKSSFYLSRIETL